MNLFETQQETKPKIEFLGGAFYAVASIITVGLATTMLCIYTLQKRF